MFSIRKTAKSKNRDYYVNILEASNKLLNKRSLNNQKYLVTCIFGEHKPSKVRGNNKDMEKTLVGDIMNQQSNLMKEQDQNKLQNQMEVNFVSWMIITHDLIQIKLEKIYKLIFSAKRSSIININSESQQNDDLCKKILEFF